MPTAYCEVAWWNRGLRAATDIAVDVAVPGVIVSWELRPREDDVAAGWRCAYNPLHAAAESDRIRIEQHRLMPKGRNHLIIGYHPSSNHASATARGYVGDREILSPRRLDDLHINLSLLGGGAASAALLWLGSALAKRQWADSEHPPVWFGLVLLGAALLVFWLGTLGLLKVLGPLYPGEATWRIGNRRR